MKNRVLAIITSIIILFTASCASVLTGTSEMIYVDSTPSNARVEVFNRNSESVVSDFTPTVLALKKGAKFFVGEKYKFVFEKDGYERGEVTLEARVSGLYFGNFLVGGPFGLLVDPFTGGMWTFPNHVDYALIPTK